MVRKRKVVPWSEGFTGLPKRRSTSTTLLASYLSKSRTALVRAKHHRAPVLDASGTACFGPVQGEALVESLHRRLPVVRRLLEVEEIAEAVTEQSDQVGLKRGSLGSTREAANCVAELRLAERWAPAVGMNCSTVQWPSLTVG